MARLAPVPFGFGGNVTLGPDVVGSLVSVVGGGLEGGVVGGVVGGVGVLLGVSLGVFDGSWVSVCVGSLVSVVTGWVG